MSLPTTQILISLDCSFTRTGVCIIDLLNKKIFFKTASAKIGEKQFENVVIAAKSVTQQLKDIFSEHCGGENFSLIMESPLPRSSMSPALYALDTLIYTSFESNILATYNPITLSSRIHGHKYTKLDSQNLAYRYLKELQSKGYMIESIIGTKRKICDDCAEAFLYTHLYLKDNSHPDFLFDNASDKEAYKTRMKELKRRTKLLLSDNN